MRLRRFEAATVAEALARVRADLGPDAIILHARAPEGAPSGGSRFGRVEVMAALDDEPGREGHAPRPTTAPGRGRGSSLDAPPSVPHVTGSRPDRIARDAEPDGEENRIEEMYRLLLELRDGTTPTPRMPEALRPVYRELCRREVPAAVVRKLCADLPAELRSGRSGIRRPALHAALGGVFRVQGHPAGARQRVMALVGPTGVGKTTTIAKLAGQCRQTGDLRPALVSLDTYRIGATAQMQIYAELLGAPLHVVRTPSEFAGALRAEAAADVVLVDSTGRSPQHREGIQALRTFLQEIPHPEIHLVVSATTKASDLEEILRRFRPVRYQHLLITKLDEAQSPGPVLGLALQENLSISYLATGQEVPDDLELATPQRLASFLLPSRRGGGSRALAGA